MTTLLDGLANPVCAAPMSGGPTTPALVIAAAHAGSVGFLAAGYKTAAEIDAQIRETRAATAIFGVNLFAPNPVPIAGADYARYADTIRGEGEPYGLDLTSIEAREDDDDWAAKIDGLLHDPVPIVSFTFGIPTAATVAALQKAGTLVAQTVTSLGEAALSKAADLLVVQGHEAGGHYGTLTPATLPAPVPLPDLVQQIRRNTRQPIIAAGGLASPDAIKAVLHAGASAVAVGTYLLLTDESAATPTYKAALDQRRHETTIVTRSFSGRPARAIPNGFTDRYDDVAPSGYPAIHYLTSPMRRAAHEAGDQERINIWAGTGHAFAPSGPAAAALEQLAATL